MAQVKITVKPNGPFFVEGEVEIIGVDGQVVPQTPGKKGIGLCRCGLSSRKPFCDGNHGRSGWQQDSCYTPPETPGPV